MNDPWRLSKSVRLFIQCQAWQQPKNFDSPCLQKTTKNSDISLKQHFTLMKIQLNCFVSIWYLAKILNNSQWVVFQQNLITDNFSVVFSLSHYSATAIWCSIHDGIYDKAFLNQLFKIKPFSRCILKWWFIIHNHTKSFFKLIIECIVAEH